MHSFPQKPFLVILATVLLIAHSHAAEPKPQIAELKPEILKFEPFTWPGAIPDDCPFQRSTNFNAVRFLGVKSGYYVPEYALDHNNASLWRAATDTYPQSLTVDLGEARSFSEIQTTFEYPALSYKYLLETSEDGSSWRIHSDKRAEFPVAVNPHRNAGQSRARFVRITLVACQRPENSGGISGFRVLQ